MGGPSSTWHHAWCSVLVGLVPWVGASPAEAEEPRAVRIAGSHWSELYDSSDGLPSSECYGVAQDEHGFVWVGTSEGIARFDGAQVLPVSGPQTYLVLGSGNRIVVYDDAGRLYVARDEGLRALPAPPEKWSTAVVDDRARVWVAATGIHRLEADRGWVQVAVPCAAGDVRLLGPADNGTVFVARQDLILRVGNTCDVLGAVPYAFQALERGDGSVVVLANTSAANNEGAVMALSSAGAEVLYRSPARVIKADARNMDVFVAFDNEVVHIRPDGQVDALPSSCCGGVLADRDGGLWIASERGLVHYPAPDVFGFRGQGAIRMLPDDGDGLWVSNWVGVEHTTSEGTSFVLTPYISKGAIHLCADVRGAVWSIHRNEILRFRVDGDPAEFPGPGVGGWFHGCAHGAEGRTWFGSARGLLSSDPEAPAPRQVAAAPPEGVGAAGTSLVALAEAPPGRLWYAVERSACHAAVDAVLHDTDPGWECGPLSEQGHVLDLEAAESGALWAAVVGSGVLRTDPGPGAHAWTHIPASQALRTGTLGYLTPSPRGGMWVLAEGDVLRVEDAPDTDEGWRVLERLGTAQGVRPAVSHRELVETASGDLWLSGTDSQTIHVPAGIRNTGVDPPEVFVASLRSKRGAHDPRVPLTVPYEGNRLELRFSAPSFGRGAPVRYRFRLDPEEPWSPPSRDATLQLAALAPGRYTVEVQASTDGNSWSPEPARVELRVRAPWFLQGWFVAPSAGLLLAGAYAVRQARRAASMRLEAQRARIARDLHDEIGSGLGTIGLLAGLAVRRTASAQSQVAQIESLATELGTSLTDIVTSLRSGAANLRALHRHVVDRGRRLCAAPPPRFDAEPSESIAAVPVSLAVRINVLLVAVEAIHNAVRHARASTIRLGLTRVGQRAWLLTVQDDGIGMPSTTRRDRPDGERVGMGLDNLRSRAGEIGAEVFWTPTPGGGTTVQLRFDPDEGHRRRWVSWFVPSRGDRTAANGSDTMPGARVR